MRDALIALIVAGSLPLILSRPYLGVLVWSWLGYMNPHRLTWGFAYDFPFAQVVAITTLIALFFDKEKKRIPATGLVVIWFMFIVWMSISTLFSLVPDLAWLEWGRSMKIQIFAVLTLLVMNSKERINWLVVIIVLSLGFFGVKGGVFSLLTGGNYLVWGPPGSFIEGNNSMGLALVMTIPMMWYLYMQMPKKIIKVGILASIGLTSLAILTTHSRGAFLAIIGMALFLWLKSRKKAYLGLILIFATPVLWFAMPEEWHDRMGTIQTYEQDGSAMGRINAWWFAYNLALDNPLTGGGFSTFEANLFKRYAPDPFDFHDAHSIYFEVLGEHGFVGITLFLAIGLLALLTAGRAARRARSVKDLSWASDLAAMLQTSLVGYAIGGLFLGLAYFDLYYHLVVLVVLVNERVNEGLRAAVGAGGASAPRTIGNRDLSGDGAR